MLLTSDGSTHLNTDTNLALGNDYKQRLSVPDLNRAVQPVINSPHKDKRDRDRGFMSTGHKTKIRKALMKFNFLPRNVHRYFTILDCCIKVAKYLPLSIIILTLVLLNCLLLF